MSSSTLLDGYAGPELGRGDRIAGDMGLDRQPNDPSPGFAAQPSHFGPMSRARIGSGGSGCLRSAESAAVAWPIGAWASGYRER